MAVAVAIDAALLLRIGGMRPGAKRALLATFATAAAAALACWSIVALQIGLQMGLGIWASLAKPGFGFVWTLLGLAAHAADLAWLAAALLLAFFAGR
jgi:hypothetical protein